MAYLEEESPKEDLEKIPVLSREDISREIAPVHNEEKPADGIKNGTPQCGYKMVWYMSHSCLICPAS